MSPGHKTVRFNRRAVALAAPSRRTGMVAWEVTSSIPLFPLPLVLFPGAVQALHIFEPRYRRMLADCLAAHRPFGVICVLPGQSERALPPGTVGCLAHIESSQILSDGRSNIMVLGEGRFSLVGYAETDTPYLTALVEGFEDSPEAGEEAGLAALAGEVSTLFARAGQAARQIQDESAPLPELPLDPGALSFAVAQYLDLELDARQHLLTLQSPQARLSRLRAMLASLIEGLEARAAVHAGAKRNGHGPHTTSA